MYCNFCGKTMQDDAIHCSYCGRRIGVSMAQRKLQRPRTGRKVAGVCLGFAEYFGIDVTAMRIIWLVAIIMTIPLAIIAYIAAWIVMPEAPEIALAPTQAPVPYQNHTS